MGTDEHEKKWRVRASPSEVGGEGQRRDAGGSCGAGPAADRRVSGAGRARKRGAATYRVCETRSAGVPARETGTVTGSTRRRGAGVGDPAVQGLGRKGRVGEKCAHGRDPPQRLRTAASGSEAGSACAVHMEKQLKELARSPGVGRAVASLREERCWFWLSPLLPQVGVWPVAGTRGPASVPRERPAALRQATPASLGLLTGKMGGDMAGTSRLGQHAAPRE